MVGLRSIGASAGARSGAARDRDRPFPSLCDGPACSSTPFIPVADRAHGYCVDDNARALLFFQTLASSGEAQLPEPVTATFCGIRSARLEPDTRRFRNFHGLRRRWLEATGSEDSPVARCGRWANAPPTTTIHPAADGPRRSSRPRFRGRGVYFAARLGLHVSWGWMPIAGWSPKTPRQPYARLLADRLMSMLAARQPKIGLVRRRARLRQRRACRRR